MNGINMMFKKRAMKEIEGALKGDILEYEHSN